MLSFTNTVPGDALFCDISLARLVLLFAPCLQESVYDDLGAPLLNKALDGYNATIFAYGQVNGVDIHSSGRVLFFKMQYEVLYLELERV